MNTERIRTTLPRQQPCNCSLSYVILVGERTVLLNQVALFSFMEISLCRAARSLKHQQRIHSLPCWCLVVPSVGYYQYAESEQYLTKMTYDVSLSSV